MPPKSKKESISYNENMDHDAMTLAKEPDDIYKYLIYLRTEHIYEIKSIIEILRELLNDTAIYFTKDKTVSEIRIAKKDENESIFVVTKLYGSKFINYHVKHQLHIIGVDLIKLYKVFKIIREGGILTMYIEENDDSNLKIEVNNKNITRKFSIKLLDINAEEYNFPKTTFPISVKMVCSEFHRTLRDLAPLSDHIEFVCTKNKLYLNIVGDSDTCEIRYDADNQNDDIKIIYVGNDDTEDIIVKGIYVLSKITMFTKCSNICETIQLFMNNNYPLFIKYKIAALGEMIVGIAPTEPLNRKN